MTISINRKHIPPPPPHQRTMNRRLASAGLLAVFALAALILTSCPSPAGTATYTTTVTGTHNAGTLPLTPGPKPSGTARYSITQKSPGSFKLTVKEGVREIGYGEFSASGDIITTAAKSEGADKGKMITEIVLPSTLKSIGKSGLADHTRMSGTLTIPRNVETLAERAFRAMAHDKRTVAVVFETGSNLRSIGRLAFSQSRLKDFTLPENLETIESFAFLNAVFSPGTSLIIPSKVFKIGRHAFSFSSGITAVDILSDELARKRDVKNDRLPLGDYLFKNASIITQITLPQKVYGRYKREQLKKIFGDTFKNYLKPGGKSSYNFDGKL